VGLLRGEGGGAQEAAAGGCAHGPVGRRPWAESHLVRRLQRLEADARQHPHRSSDRRVFAFPAGLEAAFREYGMPEAIRTDNSAPFASCAIAGLSRLSVWWMKLDIAPERIAPPHPEQNGRHERTHGPCTRKPWHPWRRTGGRSSGALTSSVTSTTTSAA
jgi:hypothetical protein